MKEALGLVKVVKASRVDARREIKVPATSTRKAYSYFRNLADAPTSTASAKAGTANKKSSLGVLKTVAIATGLTVVATVVARERYRQGFKTSAAIVKEKAKSIAVEKIPPEKKNITFSVGGFYGTEGVEAARKGENYLDYKLKTEILDDDHYAIKHENKEFNNNYVDPSNQLAAGVQGTIEHYGTVMHTALIKGYNPESRNLAAKVLAYHKEYPDKPINSIGHSAGGMINRETAAILAEADPTSRDWFTAINLGSANFGFVPEAKNVKTIALHSDLYLKANPAPSDVKFVGDPKKQWSADDHRVRGYMNSPEVRAEIQSLTRKSDNKAVSRNNSLYQRIDSFVESLTAKV